MSALFDPRVLAALLLAIPLSACDGPVHRCITIGAVVHQTDGFMHSGDTEVSDTAGNRYFSRNIALPVVAGEYVCFTADLDYSPALIEDGTLEIGS